MDSGAKIQSYIVTCQSCKGESHLKIINDTSVMYIDHLPIISSRLRKDMKWGFECICGNSSLVASEEKDDLDFLVQMHDPIRKKKTIKQIAKTLSSRNHLKFRMVES